MILSDASIKEAMRKGRLRIEPTPLSDSFSPSAIDLRVGERFWVWKRLPESAKLAVNLSKIRLADYDEFLEEIPVGRDGLVIVPDDELLLAPTLESIELPIDSGLAARIEGRSSFARLGLTIHMTAPTIHMGFRGPIMLEMRNHGPFVLKLKPGDTRICQIIVEEVAGDPEGPLRTDFLDQQGPLGLQG